MITRRKRSLGLWLATAILACVLPVQAFDQPTVNLGLTSFVDGGPPAGPGLYYAGYFQYYAGTRLVNHGLDKNADLDAWSYVNQLIYQSDQHLLPGATWGLDVILPVVSLNSTSTNAAITESPSGLGDLLVGPYLQWDPIMGDNGPIFMQRVELQMLFPTGKYEQRKALNPGSNFFSFNPYWAGTFFLTPKWTASCRVHYLWNDENEQPWTGFGLRDTQAGQAWHMNFASAYEVVPKTLRLGMNGYFFRQITDSKSNGAKVAGYEQVLGLGPGVLAHLSPNTHLFANLYVESNVRNRPKGSRTVIRLVHHF